MNNSLDSYKQVIESRISSPEDKDLDILIAYNLVAKDPLIEKKIKELYSKKQSLEFLKELINLSGSNILSPNLREEFLASENPFKILSQVNYIAGKRDATEIIRPFAHLLKNISFQEAFLAYQEEAFNNVVSVLHERLPRDLNIKPLEENRNNVPFLYREENIGKSFISVDIRSANWTALQYWDPSLLSWEDFLSPLLPEGDLRDFFLASKKFRQITLGVTLKNLRIMKQVEATQVMLISETIQSLIQLLGKPIHESNDERIFSLKKRMQDVKEAFGKGKYASLCHLTYFKFLRRENDGCYLVKYHQIDTNKKYTMLRCAGTDKIEARYKK